MKPYQSLFKLYRDQPLESVFAHAYPIQDDYDKPFTNVAAQTIDGLDAWAFHQPRFSAKHPGAVPKLKNYLNYTFIRLLELEQHKSGKFFSFSEAQDWVAFNSGLQNSVGADLLAVFQKFRRTERTPSDRIYPDWVFKGCVPPN